MDYVLGLFSQSLIESIERQKLPVHMMELI